MAGGIEAGIINVLVSPKLVDNFAGQLGNNLEKELNPIAEKAGKAFSEKLSDGLNKAGKSLTKNVTAPLLAVGAVALKAGAEIDSAFDNIRVKTGATGDDLLKLQESFRNVGKSVSAPFEQTSEVIATLNQRLGLTNEPLENLATQILNLNEITGEATDTNAIADFFNVFGVSAEDQQKALDQLFVITQKTGVGFNELVTNTTSQAAAFKQLGFNAIESAGFVGQLEQSGANTGAVIGSLNKAIANSVSPNKDAEKAATLNAKATDTLKKATLDLQVAEIKYQEILKNPKAKQSQILDAQNDVIKLKDTITQANLDIETSNTILAEAAKGSASTTKQFFQDTINNIKELIEQGNEQGAQELAKSVFGARNFTSVLQQIQQGTFDVDKFNQSVISSAESINGVADETRDWQQQLAIARNNATVAFEPIANIILPALNDALEKVIPKIETIANKFKELSPETQKLILIVGGIAAALGPGLLILAKIVTSVQSIIAVVKLMNLAFLANPIVLISAAIIALVVLIVKNFDSIKETVKTLWDNIKKAFSDGINFIKTNWQTIIAIISGPIGIATLLIIKNWDKIKSGFSTALNAVINLAKTTGNAIAAPFVALGNTLSKIWDRFVINTKAAINFVVNLIANIPKALSNLFSAITKLPGLNVLSNILSGAKNIIGKIPGLAEGGYFESNKPIIVGEKGPELLVPKTAGMVLPNNILSGMISSGSAVYNVVINNPTAEPSSLSIPSALRRTNLLRSQI